MKGKYIEFFKKYCTLAEEYGCSIHTDIFDNLVISSSEGSPIAFTLDLSGEIEPFDNSELQYWEKMIFSGDLPFDLSEDKHAVYFYKGVVGTSIKSSNVEWVKKKLPKLQVFISND